MTEEVLVDYVVELIVIFRELVLRCLLVRIVVSGGREVIEKGYIAVEVSYVRDVCVKVFWG